MTRSLVAALLVASAFACGRRAEKPPPATCARCGVPNPPLIGHVGPPSAGGAGGESGTDESPVRLQGEVRVLNDISGFQAIVFREPADLLVEGRDTDVRGRWTGSDASFSLPGVKRGPTIWAAVTPDALALPTLQPIDTRMPNSSDVVETVLTVVETSELDLALSVLAIPVTRDETKAQAVLVVLKGGAPAAGVKVSAAGAEVVVYTDNGNFSNDVTNTDPSGIFLLGNVPAAPWPGSGVTLTLSGAVAGRWDLRVMRGGVTFGAVGN